MSLRLIAACAALELAACGARARAEARAQPGPASDPAPDGYEDCTQGGQIALSVVLTDATTGRGLPWRVVPFARVEWHAGRSSGSAQDMPNFGPNRDCPTEGVADRYGVGVAWGRPGTYALRVSAPGYRAWDTTGVRVPARGAPVPPYAPAHCAIGPGVVVEARLRPAPRGAP